MANKSRSKAESDRLAYFLFAGMAVVALLIGGFFAWRTSLPVASGELQCIDGKPGNAVAILVDKSDEFTPAQQDELQRLFERIEAGLIENDLLSIYILNEPDSMKKKPSFAMCVPKRSGNSLYENDKRIRAAFDRRFGEKLHEILGGAVEAETADASPILEMVQRISRASYFQAGEGGKRKLYIISDMMQHTNGYSFYSQPISIQEFSESSYGKALLTDADLSMSEVTLVVIPRSEISFDRSQDLKKFWIDVLRRLNVASVDKQVLP